MIIIDSFLLLCLTLDEFMVGEQTFIDNNLLLRVVCMLISSFVLTLIDRRWIEWHPTIFEVEVECCLQGLGRENVW